jgi:hypothetical protein
MSELEAVMKEWLGEKGWVIDDNIYISHKLMFHYALLINPSLSGFGYEQRYCYKNLPLLVKAIEEFKETGKLRYWQKDHSNNISVVGNKMYPPNSHHIPENAIGEVDWNIDKVSDYA